MLKEIVEYAVKQLVESPEQVTVVESQVESKVVVEVHVAQQDLKRVIGKDGRVVRALRAMLNSIENVGPLDFIVK